MNRVEPLPPGSLMRSLKIMHPVTCAAAALLWREMSSLPRSYKEGQRSLGFWMATFPPALFSLPRYKSLLRSIPDETVREAARIKDPTGYYDQRVERWIKLRHKRRERRGQFG